MSESLNILRADMGGGHMCICIPNMKFLCLNLWLGEVRTDDANNANDTNDDDRQSMIV